MGLFLSPIDRASYALIGTLTKSVVYLLGFLNAAIFTIALQRKRDLKGVKDILTITVMVMIIILIFAVVVTFLWGDEIVVLVYGDHEILTSRFMFELLVASIPIILTSVISPFFMLNPDWSLIGVMSFSLITFCLLGFTWINSIENLILNNFLMGISLVLIYLGKYLRKKISIFELGTSVDKD
jgi:O-antigen/teichoic acid export membrane protein